MNKHHNRLPIEASWQQLQKEADGRAGIHVSVASDQPEKLLGVRDGFERYYDKRYDDKSQGRRRLISVVSSPDPKQHETILPLSDEDTVELAWSRAHAVRDQHENEDDLFCVGCEVGVVTALAGPGERRQLVRCWAVVLGLGREAWGSSGSIQLPSEVLTGLDSGVLPAGVPGTRRSGGMVSSLTGGLESRRSIASLAVFNALSTLFYGFAESR